jgi:hypothetical protein
MKKRFIRIIEIFFAVRLRLIWIVPVFVNLFWNPCFHLPLNAATSKELSENQGQKQTTLKKSLIKLQQVPAEHPSEQPQIIYNGPSDKIFKFKLKTDIFETFKPEIDIFRNVSSDSDENFSSRSSSYNEFDNRFEILRLKQKLNGFNCGLEYRYVAKNLNGFNRYKNKTETKTKVGLKNDQEGVEIWGEKKIGSVGLKTFFSRFLDNVDRDPTLPQRLTHKYGLEMNYKIHLLPIMFYFSHSREESENNVEPGSPEYQGTQKETYKGSMQFYGSKRFNITASSSYSLSRDLFHPDQETITFRNGISSSIHPALDLTVTPIFSFGEYRYLWYGAHEIHPSAAIFIRYRRLFNAIDLSFLGRYSESSNSDQSIDNERLSTSIGLTWNGKSLFSKKTRYSFDLGFNQYVDNIEPANSCNSLSASFKLEFQL